MTPADRFKPDRNIIIGEKFYRVVENDPILKRFRATWRDPATGDHSTQWFDYADFETDDPVGTTPASSDDDDSVVSEMEITDDIDQPTDPIGEPPPAAINVNDRVKDHFLGEGTVLEIDGDQLIVNFDMATHKRRRVAKSAVQRIGWRETDPRRPQETPAVSDDSEGTTPDLPEDETLPDLETASYMQLRDLVNFWKQRAINAERGISSQLPPLNQVKQLEQQVEILNHRLELAQKEFEAKVAVALAPVTEWECKERQLNEAVACEIMNGKWKILDRWTVGDHRWVMLARPAQDKTDRRNGATAPATIPFPSAGWDAITEEVNEAMLAKGDRNDPLLKHDDVSVYQPRMSLDEARARIGRGMTHQEYLNLFDNEVVDEAEAIARKDGFFSHDRRVNNALKLNTSRKSADSA